MFKKKLNVKKKFKIYLCSKGEKPLQSKQLEKKQKQNKNTPANYGQKVHSWLQKSLSSPSYKAQ